MLLEGKRIIITGVGPGMGQRMAAVAAQEGARVVIGARNGAFLETVRDQIEAGRGACIALATDVRDEAACGRLVDAAVDGFGGLDGLVNSAYAPATFSSFEESSTEAWQANMDVTCFGALRMARAALPALKQAAVRS